jgi:gliding motility-associated-like protein
MIKRASSILLTLFLLLLGINTASASPSCSTTFSRTKFEPKTTGATYYELNEVNFSEGISTEMNASLKYVKNNTPKRGEYTVSGNTLSLGCQEKGTLLSISIPKLKPNTNYSISITGNVRLRGQESDASQKHRRNFVLAVGNDKKNFEKSGSEWQAVGTCNMDFEFKATSTSAIALLSTDYSGDCYILDITEIKIVGCYDPQIVSSAGDLIPKGYPCTFSAIGLSGSITWKFIDEDGVTHPLSGTGNSVTIDNIVSGGTIYATSGTTTLDFKFRAIISCSEHADKQTVVDLKFIMPTGASQCKLGNIQDDDVTSRRITPISEYCYGYYDPICNCDLNNHDPKQETLPSGSGPKEEHYVIAKSTDGMFAGWSQNEKVESATDDGSGFMIVNCGLQTFNLEEVERGQLNRGKICEFTISQLCPNTWYDFSAQVRDIDQNPSDLIPTNVRFVAIGANNEILLNYPTGTIPEAWTPKGQSFNTGNNSTVKLILYNNQDPGTTTCGSTISGSDLGLDDIKFTRCIPKLGTFSDQARTEQGGDICNDRSDVSVTLYSGHSQFGITDMINDPYYVFLKSKNGGTWKIVNSTPINDVNLGYAELTDVIATDANDAGSKYQYTSVVAGHTDIAIDMATYLTSKTPSTYDSDRENYKYTGSTTSITCEQNLYAFGEKITTYTVVCANPCTESLPPTMKNYSQCPTEATTIDLASLIDKVVLADGTQTTDLTSGTFTWYKQDPTGINPLPDNNSNVSFPSQGQTDTYQVKFTQNDDAGATYCISSSATTFTVSVLPGIVVTLDKESIIGCLSELSETDRTFEVTKVEPSTVTSPSYKWTPINADGTEGTPVENTNKYTLDPTTVGNGTVKLLVKGNLGCDATKTLTYNIANNPQLQLEGVSVPCKDKIAENGIIVKLKGMSGSNALKITRTATDENGKVSTTAFTSFEESDAFNVLAYTDEAEFTFVDKYIDASYFSADFDATKITSVKYYIILGVESSNCKAVATSDIFAVSNVKEVKLSSTAINIKKEGEPVEYHICEGTDNTPNIVTVTADCELNPEETIQWYINGEKVESLEGDIKSYTLTGLATVTEFKAEIVVAEAYEGSYETCGGEATIKIYVDAKPVVTVDDIEICVGDDRNLSFVAKGTSCDEYTWSPITYLSDAKVSNPQVIDPKEGVIDYTLTVEKGVCTETINEIKLTVNPLPVILSITPKSEEENNSVVITMDESIVGQTFAYSLDGINYVDLPDGILENTPIGWNVLYVIDNNECTNKKEFYVEPVPINPDKYFTPNGDGNHELWTVKNLESYDSYIIEIFDRHGKRLFIQRVGSFNIDGESEDGPFLGWNGEYNGHLMPSDDYWYLITLEDVRKQYTGHFTLKR